MAAHEAHGSSLDRMMKAFAIAIVGRSIIKRTVS